MVDVTHLFLFGLSVLATTYCRLSRSTSSCPALNLSARAKVGHSFDDSILHAG